jgi:hypothetical protein
MRGSGARGFRTVVVGVVFALLAACSSLRGHSPRVPTAEALAAFDEARAFERAYALEPAPELDARIVAALERAAAADPLWIAPRRLLDERAVREFEGPQVLAGHRARLAARDARALDFYLAGRLEGARGVERFEYAALLENDLPWPHHALSVEADLRGRRVEASLHARRAFERASCGYERALFGRRLAALIASTSADTRGEARLVLERVLAAGELDEHSRIETEYDLALFELDLREPPPIVEIGYRRALGLVASGHTTRSETLRLLLALGIARQGRSNEAWVLDVEGALRRHPVYANDGLLRDALLGDDTGRVFARVRGAPERQPWDALLVELESGDARRGVERWLAELPRAVLSEDDGLPRDDRLRTFAALALRGATSAGARADLAAAAFDAGLFDEAAALARGVSRDASATVVASARRTERRALAARALLAEIDGLLAAVLGDGVAWDLVAPPTPLPATVPQDLALAGVLEHVGALVERYWDLLEFVGPHPRADVAASPTLRFGPFGAVVVPGPIFSQRDAELGLGAAGARVPGLAAVMDLLGRTALIGEPPFGTVDGTVLRRLWFEERNGEHLGLPWSGLVILCDGVESAGSRSRAGLEISGAALHEGYWIDVGAERRRLAVWRAAQRRLDERGAPWFEELRGEFLLATDVGAGGDPTRARTQLSPSLGASNLVRLALLAERRAAAPEAEELVTLDDLLEVVSVHEEGHLCDRTRFLPLTRDPLGVIALAASEGFAPLAIERRLEYRAELTALACVSEPRLVLIELLEAHEVDARGPTVHAHAYSDLLADFLEEWNRELLAREPDPRLAPGCDLLHQLHVLSADEVRAIALRLAEREGLVAR